MAEWQRQENFKVAKVGYGTIADTKLQCITIDFQRLIKVETKLSSLPLSLAFLAQLNLIAAGSTDFSLLTRENRAKVQKIRNPSSFRATIVQVWIQYICNTLCTRTYLMLNVIFCISIVF